MREICELAILRRKKHLTQEKLSVKSGVSRTTIAAIEAGYSNNPTLEIALNIGDVIGIKDVKTLRRIFLPSSVADSDKGAKI